MCSHLVLMLHDEITSSLILKGYEAVFISSLYLEARESFEKRILIGSHYLAASIMDPGQINLPIIEKYLSKCNKTHIAILEELANEIELPNSSTQELPHSSHQTMDNLVSRKILTM